MASRVMSWILGSQEVTVMRVEEMAAFFGIPPGFHIRVANIIAESTTTTAQLLIAEDVDDQDRVDDMTHDEFFALIIVDLEQLSGTPYNVERFSTSSTSETGFNESTPRTPFWEPMRNIAFAREDGAEDWTITFEFDYVPGEMDWSLLYQDLFEHVHQAELLITGGEPFFQPELRYNRVGIL